MFFIIEPDNRNVNKGRVYRPDGTQGNIRRYAKKRRAYRRVRW